VLPTEILSRFSVYRLGGGVSVEIKRKGKKGRMGMGLAAGLNGLNGLTGLTTPNSPTEGITIYVQPWLLDVMWSDEDT
jgi:hypothetical protein